MTNRLKILFFAPVVAIFVNAESKCLDPEFQAELIARSGCREGQIQSCEVLAYAKEMKSFRYAGFAAFLASSVYTMRIMSHVKDLDVDIGKRGMFREIHNNQIKRLVDSVEELAKMEPHKAGFNSDRVTELRTEIKASLELIEKLYVREDNVNSTKLGKQLEGKYRAQNRLELHARVAEAFDKVISQATPYGRIQIEGAKVDFQKNAPDIKKAKASVAKADRSLAIKNVTRWSAPLSYAAGFGLAVGMPLMNEKLQKDRAKELGINLSNDASNALSGALYIKPDGDLSINSVPLAELFSDSKKWEKILGTSPGLCEALVKFNEDSEKRYTPKELKELKCDDGSVSWTQETARGTERVYFETQKNGDLRFRTSSYYIDITQMQNGLSMSQPMGLNNVLLPIGDLQTKQLIGGYTNNIKQCSNPSGAENVNRCKVGEDLIFNVQHFATIQSKCAATKKTPVGGEAEDTKSSRVK